MKEFFVELFNSIFSVLDNGWCFLITFSFLIIFFVLNLVVSITRGAEERALRFRRGMNSVCLSLILFETFALIITNESLSFAVFNIALFTLLNTPFFFIEIGKREIVLTDQQKTAVKKLDLETKKQTEKINTIEKEEKKSLLFSFEEMLKGEDEKGPAKLEVIRTACKEGESAPIEFSGVKRAIEKTLLKELPLNDREKLISLEIALLQMERGENNLLIKEEVNDGLSALLKIMSRHAV